MTLHPRPLNFLISEENFILFFISAGLMYIVRVWIRVIFTINFGPETLALTFIKVTTYK
jgi:hypothetical protein